MTKNTGFKFHEIKLKRSDKILPLSIVNKYATINDVHFSSSIVSSKYTIV